MKTSDLISFGVMPAIFVYMITGKSIAGGVIGGLFTLAALIRLAYFNVTEEERQQQTNERRTVYQGLPVTSIAGLLPMPLQCFCPQEHQELLSPGL